MQRNFNEYKSRRDFIDRPKLTPVYSPCQGGLLHACPLPVEDTDAALHGAYPTSDTKGKPFMAPAGFYVTPGLGKNEVRLAM